MPPSYTQLLNEVRDTGLEDDEEILELLKQYRRTQIPDPVKERIAEAVREKCRQQLENPFQQVPPAAPTRSRALYLGDDWKTQVPYSFREQVLNEHVLITAQSGAGKTNLICQVLNQTSTPFWALDVGKDYRHLLEQRNDVVVLPTEEIRFNPLKPPPGVPWREWKNLFIQVLCDATHLLDASQNYINKNLVPIYQQHLDDFNAYSQDHPTLHDLKDRVERQKEQHGSKKKRYHETVLNRLQKFTSDTAGSIFEESQGYDLAHLLNKNVVFELDNLPKDVQNFLMEILLEWTRQYRDKHHQRGGQLRHIFVLDEAKSLFDRSKEQRTESGIPHIDYLTSQIRTFGEALLVADQEALKLTETILANTNTKILLQNSDHRQFDEIADSIQLNPLQQKAASQLGTGEAVVQSGNNGPYRIHVNEVGIEENVSDQDVRRHLQQQTFYQQFRRSTDNILQEPNAGQSSRPQGQDPDVDLSSNADTLLKQLADNPFQKITDLYEQFTSRHQGVKAKDELLEKEFIEKTGTVNTGKSRRDLYRITENSRQHLEQHGIQHSVPGRGSQRHKYWQHRLKEKIEDAGHTAAIEERDADIYADTGSQRYAVEVALNKPVREVDHVKKHLDNGFSHVTTAAGDTETRDQIRERLRESGVAAQNTAVRVVQQLYRDEDWPHNLFNQ